MTKSTKSTMRSPNELMQAAKDQMLGGKEPTSEQDWFGVMSFLATNIRKDVAEQACIVMKRLYDIPLEDDLIRRIVRYQTERKTAHIPGTETNDRTQSS